MNADIEEIYKIENEAERNAAITNYEHTLRDRLAEHMLTRRSFIHSNRALLDANSKKNITRASITYVSKNARLLVSKICSLYEDDYLKNHEFNEEKANETRDWELAKLNERTFHSETTVFFYKWDIKCLRNEIDDFNDSTRNLISNKYVFSADYNKNGDGRDIIFADAYYKSMLMKAELERTKNDKLWRFFNFLKVAAYRDYIAMVERALESVGFKESVHGAGAIEALKNTVIQPHSIDIDNVKDSYKANINWINAQKTKEINVARAQLKKAKQLEEIQEQKEENDLKFDIKAERKPLTDEERELAHEMLKIDFRPSTEKIKEQLANAKAITFLFDSSDTITKESQGVFRANKSKLTYLKRALENGESLDQLKKEFDTSEKLLNAKYTEYKPQSLEEIEKERVQIIGVQNGNENEIKNDNAPFIKEQEKFEENQIDIEGQIKEINPAVK